MKPSRSSLFQRAIGMPIAFFNSDKEALDFYNKLDSNTSILILLNNKYDMKKLAGFSSKKWSY